MTIAMWKFNDISQVSAEMLLNYLYPEMAEEWIVDNKGTFYRNYNQDVLALYVDEKRVELARDGFLKLLPQGLLTRENELKETKDAVAKSKELERRIHLLNEVFLPFDKIHFRRTMRMEQQVSDLVREKVEYLLREYFGFDITAEENPYVKTMATMLPYAKGWRGNFVILRKAMEMLYGCQVIMTKGRYSHSDSTLSWLPCIRYELLIPGLTAEEYRMRNKELLTFAEFLKEWFIPAEVECQVKIKEHGQAQQTNTRLTLDYNTEIWT